MAGFVRYLKFIIKRERIMSSLWIGLTVLLTLLFAAIFPPLLGDEASMAAMVEMLKSPTMVGMLGPAFDGEYSVGMAFAQMMTSWIMITLAVMNIFFITRHTRADEEHGRLEMLRSLPVGRLTNAAATLAAAVILNFIIAILSTLAILLVGFEGSTLAGALSYSLTICMFGLVMASISLICAQLFSTSRATNTMAFVMLGIFYLMRAAGDYTDGIISYISPLGLGLRVFAFDKNDLYPILIMLVLFAALTAVAVLLCLKRDLGEGIVSARKGRAEAKKSLLSPFGFALRLTKTSSIIWCIVIFVIGAMYGSMLGDIESFIDSNDFYKQLIQLDNSMSSTLTEGFISVIFLIIAHLAAIPIIILSQKLHYEESRGRLEQIFARSVDRRRMMASFMVIASVLSLLLLLSGVLGMYLASLDTSPISFAGMLLAGLSYLPSLLFMGGLGFVITGALPRGGIILWLTFAYSFIVVYLGEMLGLPKFLKNLSPFALVPQLPVDSFNILPLLLLSMLAAATAYLGIHRFNKRDINS